MAFGHGPEFGLWPVALAFIAFGFYSVYLGHMSAIAQLKRDLEQRFPGVLPVTRGLAPAVGTGIAEIDRLLPGSGLARGRVTQWRPGSGATAVLRSASFAAVKRGERAAWVDGPATASGEGFAAGPLLVRPADEVEAVSCAEELLRCGGYSLVVLSGGGMPAGAAAVRLGRAAREGGSAFVLLGTEAGVAHMRVRTHIRPDGYRWRLNPFGEPVEPEAVEIELEASALGWSGRVQFTLPLQMYRQRTGPEQGLVDRRGAPPAARWARRRKLLASGGART